MDQWTLQMGYPVITIIRNETAVSTVEIFQERFIYDINAKTKDPILGNNRYLNLLINICTKSCSCLEVSYHFEVEICVEISKLCLELMAWYRWHDMTLPFYFMNHDLS